MLLFGKRAIEWRIRSLSHLVDVDLGFGGRLQIGGAELSGEVLALVLADNALVFEVALVAHQNDRHLERGSAKELGNECLGSRDPVRTSSASFTRRI